jgi:hypothetical protein
MISLNLGKLSSDDQATLTKWRRDVFILYGCVALAFIAIFGGLPDRARWDTGRGVGRRFDREAAVSNIVLWFNYPALGLSCASPSGP